MSCAVITPVFLTDGRQISYMQEMANSLRDQSDDAWHLVLVDDASPLETAADVFGDLQRSLGERLTVLRLPVNSGQGVCRNSGARWAWRHELPYCLYLDCDDRADPRRVEVVRDVLDGDPSAAFVYSSFDLIDESGNAVPDADVTPSIAEILDAHRSAPIEGQGVWQALGTTLGYSTLTSMVSVRTWLAVGQPFPDTFVSEDQHTWLRMTAATDGVRFDGSSRGKYRVTTDGTGSSVRRRIGSGYYRQKAWVDTQGFLAATKIALRRSAIDRDQAQALFSRFYDRCAVTLINEGEKSAAAEYRDLARDVATVDNAAALRLLPSRPVLFRP